MEIVIAHLTRMQPGYICAAGINTATGKHVRPCLPNGNRLGRELFDQRVMDIAAVVDIGPYQYAGTAPETEDYLCNQRHITVARRDLPQDYWLRLFNSSETCLTKLFGPDLVFEKPRATVAAGGGSASLGCLRPIQKPKLCVEQMLGKPALRVRLVQNDQFLDLSVTDLRLYYPDHKSIRMTQVEDIARRIRAGVPVILGVGLTRLFRKDDRSEPKHYLQVNNLHLEDDPTWSNA